MVFRLATCVGPKSRILVAFECFCCCHISLYVNELTKFVGTWFQWDLWFWWRASSLLTKHALTSGTSLKPFPFIYGFFLKGQNSQHVGIDVRPLLTLMLSQSSFNMLARRKPGRLQLSMTIKYCFHPFLVYESKWCKWPSS